MSLNLATLLQETATRFPDRTAIIIGDKEMSYAQILGYAQRFATGLRTMGIEPGQHVAILVPNTPHFTIAYFGALMAGCAVVPLNVLLTPDEIAYHLEDSDSVALVAFEMFLDQAKAGFDRVETAKHLIVAKADPTDVTAPDGALNLTAIIGSHEPMPEVAHRMPDDTAVILYTSGTTGRPKGAELSQFNMFFNADYAGNRLVPTGEGETTTALVTLPLFHSFGQTCMQNASLSKGGTLVLMPRFEPEQAMGLIQKHQVTLFGGVPTMYFAMLNHPKAGEFNLSSMKHCLSGGAAMPVDVMRAFDEKYGVNILEGYGLSETSPVASFNTVDRPKKPGSIGTPIWGVQFKLIAEDGTTIEENNKPGEICIRGHNVMKGYYKRPEVNKEAIVDGWFKTGDIATRDDDGFYFIVDRKKDMIIRGGFNVYPREVEETLYAHPAIGEAAVIGVPDEKLGEEVKAIVAFKPGHSATETEIIAYCKEKVAAYKYPRTVEIRDELPKTATGKILKRALRD